MNANAAAWSWSSCHAWETDEEIAIVEEEAAANSYSVEQKRQKHSNAYQVWSSKEDEQLKTAYAQACSIEQLARNHGRAPSAIRRRLEKLGLAPGSE